MSLLSSPNLDLEDAHVQEVYDMIAPHFSATRYKPWPLVAEFLLSFPPSSFVADVGCGNGKYALVNRNIVIHGSDAFPLPFFFFITTSSRRSLQLLTLAVASGMDSAVVCHNLHLPYKSNIMVSLGSVLFF
jgi:hypothetical protein